MTADALRVTIVTNIPAPYRIPVYELMVSAEQIDLTAVYLADREPNRHWTLPETSVRSIKLHGRVFHVGSRYIHVNTGIFRTLRRLRPEVLITTGYNPGQLAAIAWSVLHGVPHVVQTDGTLDSERVLGAAHRLVRRLVRRVSRAFVGASDGSLALLRSFGAPSHAVFKSPLAVDNAAFASISTPRPVDLLFSGRLADVKNPLFALHVAELTGERLGRRVRLAVAGTGPLEAEMRELAATLKHADVVLLGFLQQSELPAVYRSSRLFLFPTSWDPWGLVANEASAAAVPVLVTPSAGCADELVVDGTTGFVLPLEVERWADVAAMLLRDEPRRAAMGLAAEQQVGRFTQRAAAAGLADAARWAAPSR